MALKDKLMTLEDFKAVRDVDVASNSAQFTEIKADLDNNFGLVDITGFVPKKYINTNVSAGATVDLTEQSSNGYSYKIVECSAGDTILVNGQGGASPRLWAFLDASYKLISKSASALTGNNLIITAPANTSYCIINSETTALGECCFTPNWHGVTNAIVSNSHLIRSSALPSGADLNDYTTPGNYYVSTTAIATSLQNRPSNSSGRLTVMTLNSNSNIFQTYTNVKAEVFTREKDSNGWSDWTKNVVDADLLTVNNEIDMLKGALISNQYNILSDAIPSGADLNDYTTPGNYIITTTAIARSLVNAPMYIGGDLANSSGRLIVMSTMSANSLLQIYINAKGEIFTRRRDLVYWSYWEKKASEADTGVYATRGAYNAMQALIAQSDYNIAFANSFVPLGLKNYLGNTQNVHPKVLYFESGFGGHTYWMCYTPYPYSDDINENPCVAYSDDGYTWKNISGNPLDTAEAPNYNSDGHLVYRADTGVMELWYRYFERDSEIKTMYRMTSTDGVTWSAKELIKTFSASEDCASQAVIFDGTNYLIWGVSAGTTIDFYTAPANDVTSWTKVRTLNTAYYDGSTRVYPWHIDVIIEDNTYIILAMCRNTRNVSDGVWSLFITTSSDNITYNTPIKVVGGADSWDKYMYRSTIVKVGSKYRIYYSACSTKSTTSIYNNAYWGMGITESGELTTGYIGEFE